MDTWRGVVLLWAIPRLVAKIVNRRAQDWFEKSELPLPESFGFRRGLGTDDALFMMRRIDEEVAAWRSFGWNGTKYVAGLLDLKKAYPAANKAPFWHILTHHGIDPRGNFMQVLQGFHCHRRYCVKVGSDSSPASLSDSFLPVRGFGEGDATSPWAWNVLYSVMVRFCQRKRRENAATRGLPCGIPWRWQEKLNLSSCWARKNDGRECLRDVVEATIFADDTTLHGNDDELFQADEQGPSGMDVYAGALRQWGSREHEGKREQHVYGNDDEVCLVGGGISRPMGVTRNIQRGLKCWAKVRPGLKGTRLSHRQRGRVLMTFVYSSLAFSCKTRATRQRDVKRLQAVMNTACRYVCRTRLSRMREHGINHNDLRAKLQIPTVAAAMEREQMRWLGHVSRMTPGTSTTYAKTFARGTIEVGDFQRVASRAGGRILADRRSLPDVWIGLCHKHGISEETVERAAANRSSWTAMLDRRVAQARFEDCQDSHRQQRAFPDTGLLEWSRPAGRRPPSPEAQAERLAQQRARRAGVNVPRVPPEPPPLPAPEVDPRLPRQVLRARQQKVYYAGQNQRRISADERESWPFVCDFPGCGLRYQSERALKIHKTKASRPDGTHTLLASE